MDSSAEVDEHTKNKQPVVRGARACTVCRAAKMKCVGAEDGHQPCQRCQRTNSECVFEKHRRGRKPGSKLSEASKMLRRLEKGLNNAKLKSQAASTKPGADVRPNGVPDAQIHLDQQPYSPELASFRASSLNAPSDAVYHAQLSGSSSMDEDEGEGELNEEGIYPARLIKKEKQRNSFFGTVLGPSGSARSSEHTYTSASPTGLDRTPYLPGAPAPPAYSPHALDAADDPVKRGLMDEATAENIMDMVLIRLNPFINLFDPELHSAAYIRSRCPFLYTTLLMAGSKFFKPQLYPKCRELADQHAVRAFAEAQKSVEVVQAFMCLTYWKEPNDTKTWTYIGYACRMAVELDLNRYTARPPENESNTQRLERRNRERTYLVLFVHDRSLSMQTGRLWMLPEDEFVIESCSWHEQVPQGTSIRPEDVIVSAFTALRLIATETMKMFDLQKGSSGTGQADNYDFLLNACNSKLSGWATTWTMEMKRARGESFHHSFLEFFQLYVGLFLNSFGIQAYMLNTNSPSPSLQALGTCYSNATRCLEIIVKEFARVQMLQYSQESITTMTAYCAVMLLRLLRKSSLKASEGSRASVFALILSAAEAYKEAATMMPSSSSCAAHARFLRLLVEREKIKVRQAERIDNIDPTLQQPMKYTSYNSSPMQHTPNGTPVVQQQQHHQQQQHLSPNGSHIPDHGYPYQPYQQTSATLIPSQGEKVGNPGPADELYNGNFPNPTHADHIYYDNMCRELGVTEGVDLIHGSNFYPRAPPGSFPMMGH